MTDTTATRTASTDDHDAIQEIAEQSLTASYDLSPQDITAITETEFGDGFTDDIEGDDAVVYVAERDDGDDGDDSAVVAFAHGTVTDPATVHWLHVHPEHRGHGIGTTLFEDTVATMRDRTDDAIHATVATSAREGSEFFSRFDFEKTGERERSIDSHTIAEAVYSDAEDAGTTDTADVGDADDTGATGDTTTEEADVDFPETVTDDGEEVYVGQEILSGTDGPFAPTYKSADREEQYSYYCGNCESTDVALDSMERLECNECGNVHKSTEGYDGAYM